MPGTFAGFANRCTYIAEREEATAESEAPLDRQGSFDPQPITTYRRQFPHFYNNFVPIYARGMSIQKIAGHLRQPEGWRSRRAR
jgi:transposase-like protein